MINFHPTVWPWGKETRKETSTFSLWLQICDSKASSAVHERIGENKKQQTRITSAQCGANNIIEWNNLTTSLLRNLLIEVESLRPTKPCKNWSWVSKYIKAKLLMIRKEKTMKEDCETWKDSWPKHQFVCTPTMRLKSIGQGVSLISSSGKNRK